MKILISDPLAAPGVRLLRKQAGFEVDEQTDLSRAELLAQIGRYDALIVRSATKVDREVIQRGKNLKVIARAGAGTDNIDVEAASRQGIVVTNTPDANTLAAAEHTFALILALCRKVPDAHRAVKAGEWKRSRFMGTQVFGKTLGIIGLGRIGVQVALRAAAFGMKVVAADPFVSEAHARELGLKLAPVAKLLRAADIVTLHAPVTDATRGMISEGTLAKMKRGAFLINCARGALVDEAALAAALKSGHLAGAALDVYQSEPPTGSPLLALDNVVLTPHLAASTAEAQAQVAVQIAKQVIGILSGQVFENVLNLPFRGPFAEMRPYLALSARVGALGAQIVEGGVSAVEWDYAGGPPEFADAVVTALLRGVLQPMLGHGVNYVNARRMAADRHLKVARVEGLADGQLHGTVACRLVSGRKSRLIVGALVATEWPRIVQIDGYRLDGDPTGDLLFTVSRDVPGVIGKIGTLLGKAAVNIGEWRLGRDVAKKRAVTLINLDGPVPKRTLDAIGKLDAVIEAHPVRLEREVF
jgi:D-3-phosphoglycerate dehydrogenase